MYKITIPFKKNNYEKIYCHLYMNGIDSFLEEEDVIVVFINSTEEADNLKKILAKRARLNIDEIKTEKFTNKCWEDEWKKSLKLLKIANRFLVYPSWKAYEIGSSDLICIQIDPKMSFGTGHNVTTQLILELMSTYVTGNEKIMLDFGCGTGILAIAAAKLGVKKIIAIDIDSDAVSNATENIEINSCHKTITIFKCSIKEIKQYGFDIITANLTSNVIRENLTHIIQKLKNNGKLFLSGILKDEKQELISYLENNFKIIKTKSRENWTAIHCVKR